MSKPFYKSQTIVSAIIGYLVLAVPIGLDLVEDNRLPNEEEITVLLGGAYALEKTLSGRLKAAESIKGTKQAKLEPEVTKPIPSFSNPVVIAEPNFAEIEALPGPDNYDDAMAKADSKEEDFLQVDLDALIGSYKLVAKQPTKLKTSWKDTANLDTSDWLNIKAGQELNVDNWRFCNPRNSHLVVGLDEYPGQVFFVFAPHWQLFNDLGKEVNLEDVIPVDKKQVSNKPVVSKNRGKAFKLPGYNSTFWSNDFIADSMFTWNEATKNLTRMPPNKQVVDNIVTQAQNLTKFREYIGNKPLIVTSFYRDPVTNRRVGGAAQSSHLTGLATDVYCPSMNIWDLQKKAEEFWRFGGLGMAANRGFIHLSSDGWFRKFYY